MKHVLRIPHLWVILAIMAVGATVYYADQIPVIDNIVTEAPFKLARYSTHRILSIIPVAYAALIFQFRGGLIVAVVASLGLLPRALFISGNSPEALAETAAFFSIGLLISWLISRRRRALHELEDAQRDLIASYETTKAQQQQLQLSEERYRGLFEHAGEAILVCSINGEIISANRACELLTGYAHDEITATSIYELFDGEDLEIVKGLFAERLGNGTVGETGELRLAKKDGTEAFVRLKVSPIMTGDEVAASLPQSEILANAPRKEENFFRVKAVLE